MTKKKYPSKAVTPSGDTFKVEETEYNEFGAVREPKAWKATIKITGMPKTNIFKRNQVVAQLATVPIDEGASTGQTCWSSLRISAWSASGAGYNMSVENKIMETETPDPLIAFELLKRYVGWRVQVGRIWGWWLHCPV
jgi:hypothetical protein